MSVKACLYPLVGFGFQSISHLIPPPHSRIVSPTYGGAVNLGVEPMTGMLLSRTSWWLYYETGLTVEPIPPNIKHSSSQFMPKSLETSKNVFVRVDKVKTGLQPRRTLRRTYEGPYEVILRCRKIFIVKRNNKNESISIDRLKPAFVFEDLTKKKQLRFHIN